MIETTDVYRCWIGSKPYIQPSTPTFLFIYYFAMICIQVVFRAGAGRRVGVSPSAQQKPA